MFKTHPHLYTIRANRVFVDLDRQPIDLGPVRVRSD